MKDVEKFFDRKLVRYNYADFDPYVVFFFTMTTRQALFPKLLPLMGSKFNRLLRLICCRES